MGYFNLFLFMLWGTVLMAQTPKTGTFFPGDDNKSADDLEVCINSSKQFIPDSEVEKLVTTIMKKAFGLPNRFTIQSCTSTENCEAVVNKKGTPYILYNPEFLGTVKRLKFTTSDLTGAFQQDWETLTILAHEVGHHINLHLTAAHPEATRAGQELEADITAGYIMFKLGATLEQAQSVMLRPDVPENATMAYPSRNQRMEAIKQGYMNAKNDQGFVNPEAPYLQNALPAYLGLSGFSGLGGGLILVGRSKWNKATIWYNKYKIEPINYTNGDFEKYRSDYSTNSKLFMGLGTAVMIGGAVIFLKKIAKVSAYNRSALQGRLSSSPHKHSFKIEPLLGNTQEGLPGVGIGVRFGRE